MIQLGGAGRDVEKNRLIGIEACREAAAGGAEIVLFPEMWQIGYQIRREDGEDSLESLAIGPEDRFVESFRGLAGELETAIVMTILMATDAGPKNTALLIDRHGVVCLEYSKVHTCDFSHEAAIQPGREFGVATLDTAAGPIEVGMMICYDREFPESARVLMLKGAELILVPNACVLTDERIGQLRARSYENMVGVAMANYPAPQCDGRSCAFDGIVFPEIDGAPRDHKIVEASDRTGIVYANFDMGAIRAYRQRETWGDAYRKPYAYGPIAATENPRPPFVRSDSRRDPTA